MNNEIIISIDTETTGVDPDWNEITQIAMILLDENFDITEEFFCSYVKPLYPERYSLEVQQLTGITLDMLEDAPLPAAASISALEWLYDISKNRKVSVVAQNWEFDKDFIRNFFSPPIYKKLFDRDIRDTKRIAKFLLDTRDEKIFNSTSLKEVIKYFNLSNEQEHDAFEDAITTANLYKALVNYEKHCIKK